MSPHKNMTKNWDFLDFFCKPTVKKNRADESRWEKNPGTLVIQNQKFLSFFCVVTFQMYSLVKA